MSRWGKESNEWEDLVPLCGYIMACGNWSERHSRVKAWRESERIWVSLQGDALFLSLSSPKDCRNGCTFVCHWDKSSWKNLLFFNPKRKSQPSLCSFLLPLCPFATTNGKSLVVQVREASIPRNWSSGPEAVRLAFSAFGPFSCCVKQEQLRICGQVIFCPAFVQTSCCLLSNWTKMKMMPPQRVACTSILLFYRLCSKSLWLHVCNDVSPCSFSLPPFSLSFTGWPFVSCLWRECSSEKKRERLILSLIRLLVLLTSSQTFFCDRKVIGCFFTWYMFH